MKCPYCSEHFHEDWTLVTIKYHNETSESAARWTEAACCNKTIIQYCDSCDPYTYKGAWKSVRPNGTSRSPTPAEVPENIKQDYEEACNVLPISPKASAALSRRCLQNILHSHEYRDRDLSREIDALLNEPDTSKAIPSTLRVTIDGIRNFGNFSAHPISDQTTNQIIDVEPEEAEWCLEILEGLFDHFYVQPAAAAKKKALLNQKLAAAGKPAAK